MLARVLVCSLFLVYLNHAGDSSDDFSRNRQRRPNRKTPPGIFCLILCSPMNTFFSLFLFSFFYTFILTRLAPISSKDGRVRIEFDGKSGHFKLYSNANGVNSTNRFLKVC